MSNSIKSSPAISIPSFYDGNEAPSPQSSRRFHSIAFRYGSAIFAVLIVHGFLMLAWHLIGPIGPSIFLAAVILVALYFGRGPALLTIALASLDTGYTFMPPYQSVTLNADEVFQLGVFLMVALLTSSLQSRRLEAERSLRSEQDILEISDHERERIGHDLHDGLGQELTGIAMLATALAERLQGNPANASDAERIADLVNDCIRHSRDLAKGLCPINLEDAGLASALKQLADQLSRLPNIQCSFTSNADLLSDPAMALHLYRIAQEAINNALRHGHAKHIELELTATNGQLMLRIADDGSGIPANPSATGLGLRLMNYRAKMIRGILDIHPGSNGGTVVACKINRNN